ncbi:hypothetical protein NDU88_005530 [Pleurodeles waltl]|uniref:Uncharacterized protein n=1 Tax=Pleurodeles waltl TaxID=8319 RepID=A0AAV7LXK6_PLEWA|nr:hypothetical protein NDU88_005530 [Pleurodeles waltl]
MERVQTGRLHGERRRKSPDGVPKVQIQEGLQRGERTIRRESISFTKAGGRIESSPCENMKPSEQPRARSLTRQPVNFMPQEWHIRRV